MATSRWTRSATSRACFNPRHPRGWRLSIRVQADRDGEFQSTPPARVATPAADFVFRDAGVSIHATRAGGDTTKTNQTAHVECFNPRHPRGWRLARLRWNQFVPRFQSTPPARVATLRGQPAWEFIQVSIHATRAGGDQGRRVWRSSVCRFNPRHPRGWRPRRRLTLIFRRVFQSTPPARVATLQGERLRMAIPVSIHATRAGGDNCSTRCQGVRAVSIHATRAGGDLDYGSAHGYPQVSIHATRAGGDTPRRCASGRRKCFNPRHPRGWRLELLALVGALDLFQSTPPARVATPILQPTGEQALLAQIPRTAPAARQPQPAHLDQNP